MHCKNKTTIFPEYHHSIVLLLAEISQLIIIRRYSKTVFYSVEVNKPIS